MDKVEKNVLFTRVETLINKGKGKELESFLAENLKNKDLYLTLEEYINFFQSDDKRIVAAEGDYAYRHKINIKSKVLPIKIEKINNTAGIEEAGFYHIKTSPIYRISSNNADKNHKNYIPMIFTFVRTMNNDVLFIKFHVYNNCIRYYILNLEKMMDKIIENGTSYLLNNAQLEFYSIIMPELLSAFDNPDKKFDAINLKDVLLYNSLYIYINYNISNRDDLHYIKQSLYLGNPKCKEIIAERTKYKKELILGVDDVKIKVKFYESQMECICNNSYRSKNGISIKDDIQYVLIKVHEPIDNGKYHYILVTGFHNSIKNPEKRKTVSVLFRKDTNGNYIIERDLSHREAREDSLPLTYTPLSEVNIKQLVYNDSLSKA